MISSEITDSIVKISQARDFHTAWYELKKGAESLELRVPYYVCAFIDAPETEFKELEDNNSLIFKDEYSNAFNEFYNDGCFANFDLALDWTRDNNRSALWSEIFRPVELGNITGKHKEFYRTCQDMDMKTGAMIPFKNDQSLGFGAMTILTPADLSLAQGNKLLAERLQSMEVLARVFHASCSLKTQAVIQFKLTEQERDILQCICNGKMAKQIAFEKSKSKSRVEKQIANIKQKLGAKTMSHAVAKAIYFDLV